MIIEPTTDVHALEYAGFWRRLGAFLIDVFIVSVIIQMLFRSISHGVHRDLTGCRRSL
jgi:uncharacterized RDD family membrane protein YckC